MFYFSSRALNEVHDGRISNWKSGRTGSLRGGFLGFGASRSAEFTPGSIDQVAHALKRAKRAGRRPVRDLWDLSRPGGLFDIEVESLHVGIMPFLRFGDFGEGEYVDGKMRPFWAHGTIAPRVPDGPVLELVMMGSRQNLANESHDFATDDQRVGFDFPSDPNDLGRILSWELELDANESVQDDIVGHALAYGPPEPGEIARFAFDQTKRARHTIVRDETGYLRTWEMRPPLAKTRIVGTATDLLCPESQVNVVFARPIFIQELT